MIAPLVRRGTSTHSVAQAFEKSWRMGQRGGAGSWPWKQHKSAEPFITNNPSPAKPASTKQRV
jgi:hypothetical protein